MIRLQLASAPCGLYSEGSENKVQGRETQYLVLLPINNNNNKKEKRERHTSTQKITQFSKTD